MGFSLAQEWGGAYFGGKKVLGTGDEWHELKIKDVGGLFTIDMLYQKITAEKKLRLLFVADSEYGKTLSNYDFKIDLSKIITTFQTPWSGTSQNVHIKTDFVNGENFLNADNGSSILVYKNPLNLSNSAGIATDFLSSRSGGELNDTLYVSGFK